MLNTSESHRERLNKVALNKADIKDIDSLLQVAVVTLKRLDERSSVNFYYQGIFYTLSQAGVVSTIRLPFPGLTKDEVIKQQMSVGEKFAQLKNHPSYLSEKIDKYTREALTENVYKEMRGRIQDLVLRFICDNFSDKGLAQVVHECWKMYQFKKTDNNQEDAQEDEKKKNYFLRLRRKELIEEFRTYTESIKRNFYAFLHQILLKIPNSDLERIHLYFDKLSQQRQRLKLKGNCTACERDGCRTHNQ